MRRVVITGMGIVSPLGTGLDHNWTKLIAAKSGIGRIEGFQVDDLACQIAGQVPQDGSEGALNLMSLLNRKNSASWTGSSSWELLRRWKRFIILGGCRRR